jgi:hypothetical protein
MSEVAGTGGTSPKKVPTIALINPPLTEQTFAESLLTALGIKATNQNVSDIMSQENAEGQWAQNPAYLAYAGNMKNPLNTEIQGYGGTSIYGGKTQSFPLWSTGVAASAATYRLPAYKDMLNDLKDSAPFSTYSSDLIASPWAGSNYNGSVSQVEPNGPVSNVMVNDPGAKSLLKGDIYAPMASSAYLPNLSHLISSHLSGLDAIGNFFSDLSSKTMWIRIGEVLAGVVITIIGLSMLTKSINSSTGSSIPNPAQGVIDATKSAIPGGAVTTALLNSASGRGFTQDNPTPTPIKKTQTNVGPAEGETKTPSPQAESNAEVAKESVAKPEPKKSSISARDKESIRRALYNQIKIEKADAKKAK